MLSMSQYPNFTVTFQPPILKIINIKKKITIDLSFLPLRENNIKTIHYDHPLHSQR
jgi:hypothetical protein